METYVKAIADLVLRVLRLLRQLWKQGRKPDLPDRVQEIVQGSMMVGWAHACRFLQSESKRAKAGEHTYLPAPPVYTVKQAERLLTKVVGERALTKETQRNLERIILRAVRKSANSTIVRANSDDPNFLYVDGEDADRVVAEREKMVDSVLSGNTVDPLSDPTRRGDSINRRRQETLRKRRESDAEYRKRVLAVVRERNRREREQQRTEEAQRKAEERREKEADKAREEKLRNGVWDAELPKPLTQAEIDALRKWQGGGDHSKTVGYARVITGEWTCGFCVMLASRGATYKSAEKAGLRQREDGSFFNEYHYNCDCIVVPVFGNKRNYPGYELSRYYYALYRRWYLNEYYFGANRVDGSDQRKRDPKYAQWRAERGLSEEDESIRDLSHYLEFVGFQGAYKRPKRKAKRSVA